MTADEKEATAAVVVVLCKAKQCRVSSTVSHRQNRKQKKESFPLGAPKQQSPHREKSSIWVWKICDFPSLNGKIFHSGMEIFPCWLGRYSIPEWKIFHSSMENISNSLWSFFTIQLSLSIQKYNSVLTLNNFISTQVTNKIQKSLKTKKWVFLVINKDDGS